MYESNKKHWGVWLGVVIVIAFSLLILTSITKNNSGVLGKLTENAIAASDQVMGNKQAEVVLIEYGDYQCPACALYSPFVTQLVNDFPEKLAVVYRHFPLRQIHKNADASAQAAEAAGKQGKFWEMHELLYAHQGEWENALSPKPMFTRYASELGLNSEQFTADMNSDAVKDKIEADLRSAVASGLSGTPTFFINGTKIVNPRSYDEFRSLIQAEIK